MVKLLSKAVVAIVINAFVVTATAAADYDKETGRVVVRYLDRTEAKTNSNAEEARWLVGAGNWGTFSYIEDTKVLSTPMSFADSNGRIFFYMMGSHDVDGVTLTLSEAALEPTSNFAGAACGADGTKDPEDPRCAKLSIQGAIAPCGDDITCQVGKKTLFDRHPQMKDWPADHGFIVHELQVNDVWMIANYGGGGTIGVKDYYDAKPKHHPNVFDRSDMMIQQLDDDGNSNHQPTSIGDVPKWDKKVERARWVVAHSLWTTVSTVSVRLKGSAWGNIRSTVDGKTYEESTGLPVFYLPTPDPTSIDVSKDAMISLSFSEAAIAERLDATTGATCGGLDAEDPLCARVLVSGKAIKADKSQIKKAQAAFKAKHALAPWLAEGGAHTGGAYYTIAPEYITILDYYGGATEIPVKDYLEWKVVVPASVMDSATVMTVVNKQLRGFI